jgi:predicted dehydrogenase
MLNVAFYGTGRRAQPYLQALERVPEVALTALCDPDRATAQRAALPWDARVFPSYETILDESRPDALWICVEPQLQGDVILKAAELGIPFFVVPPGALDYQHAQLYEKAVAEAGLLTAVGYTARLTDIFLEAREYLGAHPVPLALAWWLARPEFAASTDAVRLLWNEACVLIDALRFFCGEVVRLRALDSHPRGGLLAQLEFQSGTTAALACALFARPEARIELEFLGEGWSLLFEQSLTALRHAEYDKTMILRSLHDGALEATTAFLDAVTDGQPAQGLPDYAEAVRTLAVCHALEQSAQQRLPIELE